MFHGLVFFTSLIFFLASPLSPTRYPVPFLFSFTTLLPLQIDTPQIVESSVLWRYLLSFPLCCCTCWSLCLYHLLYPTHLPSSTPEHALSFILETASSRKSPLVPQMGKIPPLHISKTSVFNLPQESYYALISEFPIYLSLFTRDLFTGDRRLCLIEVLTHSRLSIYNSQMNECVSERIL